VGWLMELHHGDISEGLMFLNLIDGGEGLRWLSEWWMIGGFFSGASSQCKHWLNLLRGIVRVVFQLRARWVPNVGINSHPEHGGWKDKCEGTENMRWTVVNDNNCSLCVPSMCTQGAYL
jgi:hypothetical protein